MPGRIIGDKCCGLCLGALPSSLAHLAEFDAILPPRARVKSGHDDAELIASGAGLFGRGNQGVLTMNIKALLLIAAVFALVFGISPPDPDLTGGPSPVPPDPTVLAAVVTT